MIKSIMLAAAIAVGTVAAASATPLTSSTSPNVAASSDIVQVGKKWYKGKNKYRGYNYRGPNRYRHGYYGGPPRGYRSYSYRPFGWRGRGCIAAGPVWYCP